MTELAPPSDPSRVLGVVLVTVDFTAIADRALSLRRGEILQLRPEELPKSAPVLEVTDDSWRNGIVA